MIVFATDFNVISPEIKIFEFLTKILQFCRMSCINNNSIFFLEKLAFFQRLKGYIQVIYISYFHNESLNIQVDMCKDIL